MGKVGKGPYTVYVHTNLLTRKSYVGVTSGTLLSRWKTHVWSALRDNSQYIFHRSLRKHGLDVWEHCVLEQHTLWDDALEAERFFIGYLATFAPSGYNATRGGDGMIGFSMSEEAKLKISKANTGKRRTFEQRERMSAAHPTTLSAEHAAAIGESLRGRVFSQEHREKLAAASTGKTHSLEARTKMSAAMKGKKHSAETRAKMSKTRKGKPHSAEHNAAVSAALRARAARKKLEAQMNDK